MERLVQRCENLAHLLLNFDPGDMTQVLEIQTGLREVAADCLQDGVLAALGENLASLLEPLFLGNSFEEKKDLFYEGFDLLQRGVSLYHTTGNRSFSPEDWAVMLGNELKTFFLSQEWELPSYQGEEASVEPATEETDGGKEENPFREDEEEKDELQEITQSEVFQVFLTESRTRLLEVVDIVLDLEEKDAADPDEINALFRFFHTMKGEAGFIGLIKISEITHDLETMLDAFRNNKLEYSSTLTEALLYGESCLKEHLLLLEEGRFKEYETLSLENLKKYLKKVNPLAHKKIGEMLEEQGKLSPGDVKHIIEKQKESGFQKSFGEVAEAEGILSGDVIEQVLTHRDGERTGVRGKEGVINIKASQIFELSTMVQELWIAENQIDDERLGPIKKITSQLQHLAMSFLTVEVNKLYIKLRRIIRDTAKKLGKSPEVIFLGSGLEIDRNLVEALEEPLLHLIRNSLDHGLEPEKERQSLGKALRGTITVKTLRRGNRVVISLEDDGRGLSREKILSRAEAMGLIAPGEGGKLSGEEVFALLTIPGFSTATQVSDLSGRGVGMDAVASMVREYQGRLEIYSEEGQYTRFDLIFPLNAAIIDGMVFKCGEDIFVIPVSEVVECVQVSPGAIERVKGDLRVFRLRGEIIPLLNLEQLFFFQSSGEEAKAAVIVLVENHKYAFPVSQIVEKAEVAIKPLGKKFSALKGISSGTVFSGGKIGFVLDIEQIVRATGHERRIHEQLC